MRIISLSAQDVKRILTVEVRPEPGLVQIAGKNGSGKSSLLDSILWALAGDRAIEDVPIRKGQQVAKVVLELGEGVSTKYKVTKTIRALEGGGYDTKLRVEDADGPERKPQAVLDAFLGDLTLDPVAFINAKPAERLATLKRIVPGAKFDEWEAQRQRARDKRTEIGREVRRLEGVLTAFPKPEDAPENPIDTSAMLAELANAAEREREISEHRRDREARATAIADIEVTIHSRRTAAGEYRAMAEKAEAEAEEYEAALAATSAELAAMPAAPEPIDTASLRIEITKANLANEQHKALMSYRSVERQIAEQAALHDAAEKRIDAIGAEIAAAIAEADLPVRGLGLSDQDVTLDGLPFEQASQAQQLRAGIAIAMAENPKLKVIRIRHGGNDLDEDALALIGEVALEEGFDVWIERVIPIGPAAVIMQDGTAKEVD